MTRIKPVIVLGMHRSGTSCLIGSLEEKGLYLGDVDRKKHTNPKGNRELLKLMDINNAVLAEAEATWDAPPKGKVVWSNANMRRRDEMIASFPKDRLWGFKDPRTLLTLSGWLEALPHAQLVGSFRNPVSVARSLQTRNGFSIEKGMELWLEYNRRLLDLCGTGFVPLVSFDTTKELYDRRIDQIAGIIGLPKDRDSRGASFFEPDLRASSSIADVAVPRQITETLDELALYAGRAD